MMKRLSLLLCLLTCMGQGLLAQRKGSGKVAGSKGTVAAAAVVGESDRLNFVPIFILEQPLKRLILLMKKDLWQQKQLRLLA